MDHRGFHSFGIETDGGSAMDVDHQQEEEEEEEEDHFLKFVDYARTELLPEDEDNYGKNGNGFDTTAPGWSWIVSRILKTCMAYSSGVTSAILLSDLSQAWHEQLRVGAPKKRLELTNFLRKNNRRRKLHNTVTIDSIYEKNFMSLNSSLEVVIVDAFVLPGTNIYMLTLGDYWSSNIIDLYLHRRYYDLAEPQNGILKKGREIFLTGCYLRTAAAAGSGYPRLLPTEYLVILLDEDQDDDAMLLGAQFCSDSFSSISVDSVDKGASYSLHARIENIGSLENFGSLQRKQITLVDNDGVKLKFLLWGEQILLANLFSVGSMLALERPYIASSVESKIEASEELCLEFGSATQLYLVPYIQHEEHVCVALTQNRHQSSRLSSAFDPSQGPKVSQVSLHRDSQGTIDYSNYPFQSFVVDLHDKMTGISLYGVVTDIIKEKDTRGLIFSLRIEDTSGVIWAKLHLASSWSLGRLSLGHTVFVSGMTCSMTKHKRLEVSWFENGVGASLINISCLPALLNSHCLHKFSSLSDISNQASYTQICGVRLDPIEHYHVNTGFSHSLCGHFVNMTTSGFAECSFCHINCDTEVVWTFHLKITLADESAKVLAWCTGQTAMELLQISPEEFSELPEEEQVMYPTSLANEKFVVALVNCKREGPSLNLLDADAVSLEITRAYRCE